MIIEQNRPIEVNVTNQISRIDAVEAYMELGLIKSPNELIQRTKDNFSWTSLADSTVNFTTLQEWLLQRSESIRPPRTGHIGGTWEAIMEGGGGNVDFNGAVLNLGLGYPLLFDVNQTPDPDGSGDPLYNPGFILENKSVLELPKYVYLDGEFVQTNETKLYSPFVATSDGSGNLISLNSLHRQRLSNLPGVAYVSDVLANNWERVQEYVEHITEFGLGSDTAFARKTFTRMVDRWVTQDGSVKRIRDEDVDVSTTGVNTPFGFYEWTRLFELLKANYSVASRSEIMPQVIAELPNGVPQFSKEFYLVALARLNTDIRGETTDKGNIVPHFHWGGYQMAGWGTNDGYFKNSVNVTRFLNHASLDNTEKESNSTAYTVLPAVIFSLLPHQSSSKEVAAINTLLRNVGNVSSGKPEKQKTLAHINHIVKQWLPSNFDNLTFDFRSRFSDKINPMTSIPGEPNLVIPPEYYNLSVQQLMITAGYLKQQLEL